MNKLITSVAIVFTAASISLTPAQLSAKVKPADMDSLCDALEALKLRDTYILSAVIIPADGDMPEYCRVLGYVLPAINFMICLPTGDWNGKFLMDGCGGFCGTLGLRGYMKTGLKRGYAVSSMDGGHWGDKGAPDGRWAYHNRRAEIDWAYRAVHETARVTKSVIAEYYGRKPEKCYFWACSNGGRQAVMEAWRYPKDFDGIISNAPPLDLSRMMVYGAWLNTANLGPEGEDVITAADAELIAGAVYRACDGIDGVEDGLIADPRDCEFDPASLLCDEGESEGCLSAEKIETLKAWYQGPKNSAGEPLYPGGVPLGSEPFWGWITGRTEQPGDDT